MEKQMAQMKDFISCFRIKELQEFLRVRGANIKGLKSNLIEKSLEILQIDDYYTICDIRERQLGVRINRLDDPSSTTENSIPSQVQNKPKTAFEEDKTGLFYIKKKIIPQTLLLFNYKVFPFTIDDTEYIEILENRHSVDDVLTFDTQLQLRVFKTDSGEDAFPPSLKFIFNGMLISFDPFKPKPIDITSKLNFLQPANTLSILANCSDLYSFTLNIIKKKTDAEWVEELLSSVCTKEATSKMISDKFSKDDDLQVDMLKVSINCPLGKSRMNYPCRSTLCTHLQCFDGLSYIQMNRRKPKWICPICYKPSPLKDLVIDQYFEELLISTDLKEDTTEVQLLPDGTWCLDTKCDVIEILDTPIVKTGNKTRTEVIEILDDTPKKKIPPGLLARFPLLNINRNL